LSYSELHRHKFGLNLAHYLIIGVDFEGAARTRAPNH